MLFKLSWRIQNNECNVWAGKLSQQQCPRSGCKNCFDHSSLCKLYPHLPCTFSLSVSDVMGKNSLEFPDITFLVTFLACSHSRSGRGFGRDNSMELLCVAVSASLSDG